MRRFQLFELTKLTAAQNITGTELPSRTAALPSIASSTIMAEDYITIAKKIIEPLLRNPSQVIAVTEDLQMALFALKEAAEIYEDIKMWGEAIFAWSMIKAVPVDSSMQWDAPNRINLCQRHLQSQLMPHPPSHQAYRSV